MKHFLCVLTHWGRVTHICVSKLTIIGSDNGLSPGRHQVIIWTNAGILLIGPLRTNFSEISIEIHIFSFKKMYLKMSSGNWQPSCPGLNVLTLWSLAVVCGCQYNFLADFVNSSSPTNDRKIRNVKSKCNFINGSLLVSIISSLKSVPCGWLMIIHRWFR